MADGITIKVDAAPMRRTIGDMRRRLEDLSPVMQGRAQALELMTKRDVFNAEQSPLGKKWRPLKPETAEAKRRGSTKILTDTGALQNSVHALGTKTGVRVGVSGAPATYGPTHQFGHTFNRMSSEGKPYQQKVPARPFLPLAPSGLVDLSSGPAAVWAERTAKRIVAWVIEGVLS